MHSHIICSRTVLVINQIDNMILLGHTLLLVGFSYIIGSQACGHTAVRAHGEDFYIKTIV